MRDVEGLTPASRAAQFGQLVLLKGLFHDHAQSSYIRDYKGRTMLHHLATSDIKHRAVELPSLLANDLHNLLFMQDDDGNTPLHLAIIHQNFELAQFYIKEFAKVAKSLRDTSTLHYKMEILMQNMGSKDGKSIKDLIECGTDIPRNLVLTYIIRYIVLFQVFIICRIKYVDTNFAEETDRTRCRKT